MTCWPRGRSRTQLGSVGLGQSRRGFSDDPITAALRSGEPSPDDASHSKVGDTSLADAMVDSAFPQEAVCRRRTKVLSRNG